MSALRLGSHEPRFAPVMTTFVVEAMVQSVNLVVGKQGDQHWFAKDSKQGVLKVTVRRNCIELEEIQIVIHYAGI